MVYFTAPRLDVYAIKDKVAKLKKNIRNTTSIESSQISAWAQNTFHVYSTFGFSFNLQHNKNTLDINGFRPSNTKGVCDSIQKCKNQSYRLFLCQPIYHLMVEIVFLFFSPSCWHTPVNRNIKSVLKKTIPLGQFCPDCKEKKTGGTFLIIYLDRGSFSWKMYLFT